MVSYTVDSWLVLQKKKPVELTNVLPNWDCFIIKYMIYYIVIQLLLDLQEVPFC